MVDVITDKDADRLLRIQDKHVPYKWPRGMEHQQSDVCTSCYQTWPCDTAFLLSLLNKGVVL